MKNIVCKRNYIATEWKVANQSKRKAGSVADFEGARLGDGPLPGGPWRSSRAGKQSKAKPSQGRAVDRFGGFLLAFNGSQTLRVPAAAPINKRPPTLRSFYVQGSINQPTQVPALPLESPPAPIISEYTRIWTNESNKAANHTRPGRGPSHASFLTGGRPRSWATAAAPAAPPPPPPVSAHVCQGWTQSVGDRIEDERDPHSIFKKRKGRSIDRSDPSLTFLESSGMCSRQIASTCFCVEAMCVCVCVC